jgi:hypothetical protein
MSAIPISAFLSKRYRLTAHEWSSLWWPMYPDRRWSSCSIPDRQVKTFHNGLSERIQIRFQKREERTDSNSTMQNHISSSLDSESLVKVPRIDLDLRFAALNLQVSGWWRRIYFLNSVQLSDWWAKTLMPNPIGLWLPRQPESLDRLCGQLENYAQTRSIYVGSSLLKDYWITFCKIASGLIKTRPIRTERQR